LISSTSSFHLRLARIGRFGLLLGGPFQGPRDQGTRGSDGGPDERAQRRDEAERLGGPLQRLLDGVDLELDEVVALQLVYQFKGVLLGDRVGLDAGGRGADPVANTFDEHVQTLHGHRRERLGGQELQGPDPSVEHGLRPLGAPADALGLTPRHRGHHHVLDVLLDCLLGALAKAIESRRLLLDGVLGVADGLDALGEPGPRSVHLRQRLGRIPG